VCTLPDPAGVTPPLDAAEQSRMRAFLQAVVRDGKSGVILTSRTPEDWLGDVRRLELGGLLPGEAAEMAEDVLRPYPAARAKRQERAFAELMAWLDGHPLSLRPILPQLNTYLLEGCLRRCKVRRPICRPALSARAGWRRSAPA
jgi:hypothetical protein